MMSIKEYLTKERKRKQRTKPKQTNIQYEKGFQPFVGFT